MFYVGLLVIGCCALAFSAGIHLWFWRQYYADAQPRYDEQHFARTRDAYRLALWRYRPPNAGLAQVVVLCHGAFSNSRIFDLCPQASLAKYLRDQGFDVWLIDLREIGGSRRRGFLKRVPATVMDHLREDIPAALEYVCGETGNPAVHWVGHSMGGLLALLYAQSEGARRLRSITTLGTPAFLEPNPSLRVNSSLLRLMGALLLPWIRLLAHAAAPIYVGMRVHLFAINAANIEPFVVRLALARCIDHFSYPVYRQLLLWARTGRMDVAGIDFRAGLSRVRTPVFSIVGAADPLCPLGDARQLSEMLGEVHELRVLGRDYDCERDYGHGDLLLGRRAALECFPLIAEKLRERSLDALPPPMPESPVALEPSPKLRQGFDAAPLILDAPPAIPGPYGLLIRYSPFRRRRWLQERRELRRRRAATSKTSKVRTLQRPS